MATPEDTALLTADPAPPPDEVPHASPSRAARTGAATAARWPGPAKVARWEWVLLLALLAYASLLRTWDLGAKAFWVDEAESCINALTILDHGVPIDTYLGQPIYENVLVRPWPDNPEYEFKDSSYSKKGLAIYHGWLPLYSTAGAFKAAGVEPDRDADFRGVKHSAEEMRFRTAVGRLPAVVFGLAFLLGVFFAGRAMYGPDAGWAAVIVGTVCSPCIDFARQARYYSATLALTVWVLVMIWLMFRRGLWRDFLWGALAFSLLFHSHMLSFVIAAAACAVLIPFMFRHERAVWKMLACGAIVAAAVFPWVFLTGFLGASADDHMPKARALLDFPADYLAYPKKQYLFTILGILLLAWLSVCQYFRHRLPQRIVRAFSDHRPAFLFLASWALLAFLAFLFFMPAASYFYRRLTLVMMGPSIVFVAMLLTAVGRVMTRHAWGSALVGVVLFIACLTVYGKVNFWWAVPPHGYETFSVMEHLRGRTIPPGSKVYATPNDHLTATFYTGMPVGNVAAVRKNWLDEYPGDVFLLEANACYDWVKPEEMSTVAFEQEDVTLPREQWERLAPLINTRIVREQLTGKVASVEPPLEPAPRYYGALMHWQRIKTRQALVRGQEVEGNPMFRGYKLESFGDWWPIFFYRFVGPESRMGQNLNYADRVRDAHATVLPAGWVIYHSPPREPAVSRLTP